MRLTRSPQKSEAERSPNPYELLVEEQRKTIEFLQGRVAKLEDELLELLKPQPMPQWTDTKLWYSDDELDAKDYPASDDWRDQDPGLADGSTVSDILAAAGLPNTKVEPEPDF